MADDDSCSFPSEYDGMLGARISAVFVILITSTFGILLPVLLHRFVEHTVKGSTRTFLKLFYLFARYFGAGIIIATAFIHLLAPAMEELDTVKKCVGGGWEDYDWGPCLILVACVCTFLLDVTVSHIVQTRYGESEQHSHMPDGNNSSQSSVEIDVEKSATTKDNDFSTPVGGAISALKVKEQVSAFLILEFGILFHSVIIGLNLGSTAKEEFKVLYVVLVFHQMFEGLGLGSRLCTIPFSNSSPYPWLLGLAYGFTTPISIAIGIGVRESYNGEGVTQSIVAGVLDALSSGILIYAGLVEYIGQDLIFNQQRGSHPILIYKIACLLVGVILMALLGKWA